jgi:hypothetical protein
LCPHQLDHLLSGGNIIGAGEDPREIFNAHTFAKQLPAFLGRHHQRTEPSAGGVDGGRKPGWTASNDDYTFRTGGGSYSV